MKSSTIQPNNIGNATSTIFLNALKLPKQNKRNTDSLNIDTKEKT